MTCDRERLELYHDGELPLEEIRVHLGSCESCRVALKELEKLDRLLTRVPAGPTPNWDTYVSRVKLRVRARWSRIIVGAAALLLVGLTTWNVYERLKPVRAEPDREADLARIRELELGALVGALEDPSPRVRIAAAQALARLKDERVRELLIEVARKQEPVVPNGELWTLEEVSPNLVAATMSRAEREGDARPLLDVLGRGAVDPEVGEAVARWAASLLASSRPKFQRLALAILREAEIEFPWSKVVELLDSPELGLESLEVLRAKTGRDFGADQDRWKRYFEET